MATTKRTAKQLKTRSGFAIPLTPNTDLGIAILFAISEDDPGDALPIGTASTINEAKVIATSDMRGRMRRVEQGEHPFCPYEYDLWARSVDGDYNLAATFLATEL
jgi:hypothetical protein